MAALTVRRLLTGILPAFVLLGLLLYSLYTLTNSTKHLSEFITSTEGIGQNFEKVVLFNFLGVLILTLLIVIKLFGLIRKYRANVSGSRLNARMVIMFTVISVVPVFLVFYFSFQILNRDIDKQSMDQLNFAISNAMLLSRESLDLKQKDLLKRTRVMARLLKDIRIRGDSLRMDEVRDSFKASEIMIVEGSRIIVYSSEESEAPPSRPPPDMSIALRKSASYVKMDPVSESTLVIRVAVPIFFLSPSPSLKGSLDDRYLLVTYPVEKRLDILAKRVEEAANTYTARKHLREKLKWSYLLTLGLVFMLSMAASIWAAFFSTDRLVAPITELADATREVAEGNYDKQIATKTHDELGFLVKSFNEMTRRIANASRVANESQQQLEDQRAYLQAVLSNLTSGVMTLDQNLELRVTNATASLILGVQFEDYIDQSIFELIEKNESIKSFMNTIIGHVSNNELDWRDQLEVYTKEGRQMLLCRGTTLIDEASGFGDHIIVFDDITNLMQAQKDAAWGEVARRLAHEIKNPLTPIQLSAERIRRKYQGVMDEEQAEFLDKSVHTIVQQVEAMKKMVNEFSEYARAPSIVMSDIDLNELIRLVTDLYVVSEKDLKLQLNLEPNLPIINADSDRIRQLLHNLIKNSIEAMHADDVKKLEISTRVIVDDGSRSIELLIRDYGEGFPDEESADHFEPYITSKPKGTGLGLAIVKRIVEEHNGIVWAENLKPKGAKITIRVPVLNYKPVSQTHDTGAFNQDNEKKGQSSS